VTGQGDTEFKAHAIFHVGASSTARSRNDFAESSSQISAATEPALSATAALEGYVRAA